MAGYEAKTQQIRPRATIVADDDDEEAPVRRYRRKSDDPDLAYHATVLKMSHRISKVELASLIYLSDLRKSEIDRVTSTLTYLQVMEDRGNLGPENFETIMTLMKKSDMSRRSIDDIEKLIAKYLAEQNKQKRYGNYSFDQASAHREACRHVRQPCVCILLQCDRCKANISVCPCDFGCRETDC